MPSPSSPDPPAPGELIGPFRIVRLLGAGGMGAVYQAHDAALGRDVALKVIAPHLADDPDLRARFVREARAQAALDSPHVVPVFAHGEAHGRLYIASRLVPDGDLAAWLRRHGPPAPQRAVHLVAQVADALVEAHRAGLVHRDVKAANVLLRHRGPDTVALLSDFGIATSVGTPAEDLVALGRLLWTTLTGETLDADAPVPRLPGRAPFARQANRVLDRALGEDPDRRYASAAALRDDLRDLARTPTGRVAPRPRRPVVVAGTLAAVATLTALTLSHRLGHRLGPTEDDATSELSRMLQEDTGLDRGAAECTARSVEADDDPAAAFAASFACLWRPDGTAREP